MANFQQSRESLILVNEAILHNLKLLCFPETESFLPIHECTV